MSAIPKRLKDLRLLMKKNKLAAYFIPSVDPHQSEYLPDCWKRRPFISGFSGSAGDVIVTQKQAVLWTDSRYFLQAEQELSGSTFSLARLGQPETLRPVDWLAKNLKPSESVGIDPQLITLSEAARLEKVLAVQRIKVQYIEKNLVDEIWRDRPSFPRTPALAYPIEYAGQSAAEKIAKLRRQIADKNASAHLLNGLDAIAWLFNIRASDVEHVPVAISYAAITGNSAILFIDPAQISKDTARDLKVQVGKELSIKPYSEFSKYLSQLNAKKGIVWLDGQAASQWMKNKLKSCRIIDDASPVWRLKAQKNATEINGSKAAHLRDGVAMVHFLKWLEEAIDRGEALTELSAAERVTAFRAEQSLYKDNSFRPISGVGPHGAIVHYTVTAESAFPLRQGDIFLIDSGGQYFDGTTDITRTLILGSKTTSPQNPTAEQKDRYTRVLKGHISLAQARFPKGTTGRQLDTLARHTLWQKGLNYGHGTGHGVGAYLSVHEGPQSFHITRDLGVPLEEGNILSNEPGFYQTSGYGIRIENLITVVRDEKYSTPEQAFLAFENLTLCPIDTRLIDQYLLTAGERTWLNTYHQTVLEKLSPHLDQTHQSWLREKTKQL